MATREQIYEAILAADKAGRKDDVATLGAYLQTMDAPAMSAPAATAPPAQPTDHSAARGFELGVAKPFDNLTSAAMKIPGVAAIDRFGQRLGFPGASEVVAGHDAARANNSRTGFQLLGNIAGTAPTLLMPGGVVAQGAVGGALLSDAKDVGGVAQDVVLGGLGGKAGELGMRGLGKVVAPRLSETAQRLADKGIPLTIGQIGRAAGTKLGSAAAWLEDVAANTTPITGTMINRARGEGLDKLNRAFTNLVLEPFGETLPAAVATGHKAVAYAQDRVRQAYQAVIPQSAGKIDQTFSTRIDAIAQRVKADLPAEYHAMLDDLVKGKVGALFDQAGSFSGKRVGRVTDSLDKIAVGLRRNDDPFKNEIGETIAQMREQIFNLVGRNNPAAKAQLKTANKAHAALVRLENAAANTKEGIATVDQLRSAVTRSDRSTRKRVVSRGEALGQDLVKDAGRVLSSKMGDPGTAQRVALTSLFPSTAAGGGFALGGIGGAASTLAPILATDAALSLPYTKIGQKTLGTVFAPGVKRAAVRNALERGAIPIGVASPALIAASRK